jgi:hypothetical protein
VFADAAFTGAAFVEAVLVDAVLMKAPSRCRFDDLRSSHPTTECEVRAVNAGGCATSCGATTQVMPGESNLMAEPAGVTRSALQRF